MSWGRSSIMRLIAAWPFLAVALSVPATADTMVKVRIGLAVPNAATFSPFYVAKDLGYYKEYGIDAEITAYRGGGAMQQALAAGEADMIDHYPPSVAVAVKNGVKEKIVGAGLNRANGWHVMTLADSPVRSIADLDGKTIGVTTKGATTDFFALWVAAQHGIEVKTIPVGGAGLLPALKSGQIDAAVMYPVLVFRLLVGGEGRSLFDFGKAENATLPDLWVATDEMIEKHPDKVEGVLRAVYRATAYMQQNKDFSLKYLKKFTGQDDPRMLEFFFEHDIMGRATEATLKREWLESSLALTEAAGYTDLPGIEEIYTDRFQGVAAD